MGNRPPIYYFYRNYLHQFHAGIFFIAICLIFTKIATLCGPFVLKVIVDRINSSDSSNGVFLGNIPLLVISYGLLRLSAVFVTELREYVFVPILRNVLQKVYSDLYINFLNGDAGRHEKLETGSFSQRVQQGMLGIQALLCYSIYTIIPTFLELSFGIAVLAWAYPPAIVACFLSSILVYLFCTQTITRILAKQRVRINKLDSLAHQISFEMLININFIKLQGGKRREYTKLNQALDKHRFAIVRSARLSSLLNACQQSIIIVCTSTVLGLSTYYHNIGLMTVGDIMLVVTLTIQALAPLDTLGGTYQEIKHAFIDSRLVISLLPKNKTKKTIEATKISDTIYQSPPKLSIQSINYQRDNGFQIRNLSIDIRPGSFVAIIGPSGSGKTTLARLIQNNLKPNSGEILFDDIPIDEFSESEINKIISFLPAHISVFTDSIANNISYPDSSLDDDLRNIEAARRVGIDEWVRTLPKGYKTKLGEFGYRISSGEKQRIGLARIFRRLSPILILDEPNSSLDTESDRRIIQELRKLRGRHTIIVIAHRLASIVTADLIVVMENGEIVATGSHNDLIRSCKLYERMWNAQLNIEFK